MQLTVPFFATVKVITINIINRQKNKTKQIIIATSAYKMKSDKCKNFSIFKETLVEQHIINLK